MDHMLSRSGYTGRARWEMGRLGGRAEVVAVGRTELVVRGADKWGANVLGRCLLGSTASEGYLRLDQAGTSGGARCYATAGVSGAVIGGGVVGGGVPIVAIGGGVVGGGISIVAIGGGIVGDVFGGGVVGLRAALALEGVGADSAVLQGSCVGLGGCRLQRWRIKAVQATEKKCLRLESHVYFPVTRRLRKGVGKREYKRSMCERPFRNTTKCQPMCGRAT